MSTDTEAGVCDFCGNRAIVAVSEQHANNLATRGGVSICGPCAQWALDELDASPVELEKKKGHG